MKSVGYLAEANVKPLISNNYATQSLNDFIEKLSLFNKILPTTQENIPLCRREKMQ